MTLENTQRFFDTEMCMSEPLLVDEDFILKNLTITVHAWVKLISKYDFDRAESYEESSTQLIEAVAGEDEMLSFEKLKKTTENLERNYMKVQGLPEDEVKKLNSDLKHARACISNLESDLKVSREKYLKVESEKNDLLVKFEEAQADLGQQKQVRIHLEGQLVQAKQDIGSMTDKMKNMNICSGEANSKYLAELQQRMKAEDALKLELERAKAYISVLELKTKNLECDLKTFGDKYHKVETEAVKGALSEVEHISRSYHAEANVSTLLQAEVANEFGPLRLDEDTRVNLRHMRLYGERLEVCVGNLIEENRALMQKIKDLNENCDTLEAKN